MLDLFLIVVGVFLSSIGSIFLKLGSVKLNFEKASLGIFKQIFFNWEILIGIFCYFIPVLIWIFLLKRMPLTSLQPLFSLIYIATPILSVYFLGVRVGMNYWVGVTFIIIGISVIARS